MSKELIRLTNLTMTFEDGETILDNINLYINNKEFLTLLGPSGCGKTTMLRIIGGFLTPTSGDVLFNGKRINDLPAYQRKINTVFQRYALFPHLDVYDNIAFGLRIAKVKEDEIEQHDMHSEYCVIPQETADLINRTKARGGRVICVGTTSCRTLESWAGEDGTMTAVGGWTNIYIYPGYRFKVMDALITNFHLPESTLIMLVSALAGREHVLNAYNEAVREKYRFFSFGDAMFIS